MLQQHIDKEIIELALFVKSTAANVLEKRWDIVFMDWSYLMYIIEDYQILITLLQEKWHNILQQAEWENANYKSVYDNLENLDHESATQAWNIYLQMKAETKWIEQAIFFLKKMIYWLNHLNALAKNNGEISTIAQVFIIYFGYKKTPSYDYYNEDELLKEMAMFYTFTSDLISFAKSKDNLYYIYSYP